MLPLVKLFLFFLLAAIVRQHALYALGVKNSPKPRDFKTDFRALHLKSSLSVTSHSNCIAARWLDKRCLSRGMSLYQVIKTLHVLNGVANDVELTRKAIITS